MRWSGWRRRPVRHRSHLNSFPIVRMRELVSAAGGSGHSSIVNRSGGSTSDSSHTCRRRLCVPLGSEPSIATCSRHNGRRFWRSPYWAAPFALRRNLSTIFGSGARRPPTFGHDDFEHARATTRVLLPATSEHFAGHPSAARPANYAAVTDDVEADWAEFEKLDGTWSGYGASNASGVSSGTFANAALNFSSEARAARCARYFSVANAETFSATAEAMNWFMET